MGKRQMSKLSMSTCHCQMLCQKSSAVSCKKQTQKDRNGYKMRDTEVAVVSLVANQASQYVCIPF